MSESESLEGAPFVQKDLFVLIWLLTWVVCSFFLEKKKKEHTAFKVLKRKSLHCGIVEGAYDIVAAQKKIRCAVKG